MPSLRKSRPPSLKLDTARPFVPRANQAPQAPPASPASSRLPGKSRSARSPGHRVLTEETFPDLPHGNLNFQRPTGSSIMTPSFGSEGSALRGPISPDYPGQHDRTPANQRPRSETLDSDSSILRWRPTYMQSPRLPESPLVNCTHQTRPDGQRRDSDGCAWPQQSMEAYLHLPSPEFMTAGHTFGQAPQSKDEAPEIPSNKDLK